MGRSEQGHALVFPENGRSWWENGRLWWPQQAADAVRLGLTVVAAVYLAMEFKLARPEWAAWTVLSVSLASSLEKSAWRAVGTLIGAVAALAVQSAPVHQN